jgi:hypothetical protein
MCNKKSLEMENLITAMMITRNERDIEEREKKVIEGVKSW